MAKDYSDDFKIINKHHLADIANVDYRGMMNHIQGKYEHLSDQEKIRIYNALRKEVERCCIWLGFSYDGTRVTKKD